jgi:Transglutaminase-like superfamily
MDRLSRFLRLPATDRGLWIKTLLLVWAVRLGLWALPFRTVRRSLTRFAQPSVRPGRKGATVERVVWAVTSASRYAPWATCLTQALTAKVMLARNGHESTLRLGVARSEAGRFQAHAWVENNGSVVLGGSDTSLKRYTPLATSEGEVW